MRVYRIKQHAKYRHTDGYTDPQDQHMQVIDVLAYLCNTGSQIKFISLHPKSAKRREQCADNLQNYFLHPGVSLSIVYLANEFCF
jgi:hypothetical protein